MNFKFKKITVLPGDLDNNGIVNAIDWSIMNPVRSHEGTQRLYF